MPIFRLKKDEKIETWWRSYYEIEAESIEDAVRIIVEEEIDPYDSEALLDLQETPTVIEILDYEGNILYDSSRQL